MLRFTRRTSSQLVISLLITFSLVYGPVIAVRPALAESRALPKPNVMVQQITKKHKEGELLVKFKDEFPKELRDVILQTYAKKEKSLSGRGRLNKLTLKDGFDLSNTIYNLKQMDAAIEYVEPNYIVASNGRIRQSPVIPNDPRFPTQWALANTGQNNGAPGSDIGAVAGWQRTTGSENTIIAVIDTGVDSKHPDLAENLWVNKKENKGKTGEDDDKDGYIDDISGWNFVNDSGDVTDDHGHGTAMAGIIAAEGNNQQGMTGVMWRASIMPLKALDGTGSGTISDVVEAIDYAVWHGAAVINCSFGTEGYSQALFEAISRAAVSGALVVTSAGNNGWDLAQTPYYPASYSLSNLITVAATANGDQLAEFSNRGEGQVQIAAPGVDVLATWPGNRYVGVTGTSAAAPLVTGVAGLLKTMRGWVSAEAVRSAIIEGARKSPFLDGQVMSGGVVSAGEAMIVFTRPGNGGGNGGGGNGGGGNGGGGNGGGGGKGGGGGGQPGGINLASMRNNLPKLPEPRVMVNLPPCCDYDPPNPDGGSGGSYDDYYTAAVRRENNTGRSGSTTGREGDPTIGNSATGGQSITLGSQNINFSTPAVSLGGRNGLGVNLALSYNSHSVWLIDPWSGKLGFNLDNSIPGPGWSIGFGKILGGVAGATDIPPFWNRDLSKYTYIWVGPDGTRRTLVGTTSPTDNHYKANDSSGIEFFRNSRQLRQRDGTQISFLVPTAGGQPTGKELLPELIKDRNGNFVSITNATLPNGQWVIDHFFDSLGRLIDFFYENNVLTQVRQNRGGTWRTFVKLYYAPITIQTNFTGVTLDPANINGQRSGRRGTSSIPIR